LHAHPKSFFCKIIVFKKFSFSFVWCKFIVYKQQVVAKSIGFFGNEFKWEYFHLIMNILVNIMMPLRWGVLKQYYMYTMIDIEYPIFVVRCWSIRCISSIKCILTIMWIRLHEHTYYSTYSHNLTVFFLLQILQMPSQI
jgi:hypothetical protein